MRKASYIASIVVGAVLVVAGIGTWVVVSTTLSDQKIVVADDASCLAGDTVDGPFSGLRIEEMSVYIMQVFNTAGNRAIIIGIALGIASTSLKILMGLDRSYLGGGD